MEKGKSGKSNMWYKIHLEGKSLDDFVHKDKHLFRSVVEFVLSLFCC